jgi:hypothetical protein
MQPLWLVEGNYPAQGCIILLLLQRNTNFLFLLLPQNINSEFTNHELPPSLAVLFNTLKIKKLLRWWPTDRPRKWEEYITNRSRMLVKMLI